MSNLLKDRFSPAFYNKLCNDLTIFLPTFDSAKFIQSIFDNDWKTRELKQRIRHTSITLHNFIPNDFPKAANIICNLITYYQRDGISDHVEYWFLSDYIEQYGIEHYDISVKAMETVTQFTSCEFAVRPFIIKYGDKMMKAMYQWSTHDNHHVRRLASEGSRPRLPWAMALPQFKNNPSPVFPILENLKGDPSEYVRRSVANNLNDIAKDNPNIVISIAKKWNGKSKETDALIKHACRTLLKKGNPKILKHFGLADNPKIKVTDFKVLTPKVNIGDSLEFSFSVHNTSKQIQTARVEYGLYYLRQNGQLSRKVFKISERQLKPNEKNDIKRKQSFKLITTRTFYTGQHELSIIINGQEKETNKFRLVDR